VLETLLAEGTGAKIDFSPTLSEQPLPEKYCPFVRQKQLGHGSMSLNL
jgi:hypothetical protein